MIAVCPVETEEQVEAYLDLRNRIEPADPVSRAGFEASRRREHRLDVLALVDGAAAGMGFVGPSLEDASSSLAFGKLGVVPQLRNRGVGTRVLRALSRHAASFGHRGLVVEVGEHQREALDYLGKRGFEPVLRAQEVGLDLATASVEATAPAGVELVPLVDEALDRHVHEAAVEIERDLPAIDAVVTPPLDEWRARVLSGGLLRGCSFAAVAGTAVVGFGTLYARPWGAVHGLTGVRRAWRRRGVARSIKGAQIEAARAAGLRELRTSNEVDNVAIRRLNDALGYRPVVVWLHLRGPLLDAAE